MSAWWSPNLTGVAPGAATGVKSPFGEFVQRDPNRAIGYQDQSREGQFPGQGAPPTTGYTTAKYNTNIAYDPSRDAIGAGRDVLNWTNGLVEEYRKRGVNLDWNAVYADQWARKKRDLLAWGNAGDLARAGVDMNAIDANAHDIGNAGWEERFKAGGYTGGQGQAPAATAAPQQAADTRSKALDDPYRIGAFTGGYYDPGTVSLLLDRATGKGDATPDERMQAAQVLKTVGLMGADNTPGDVAKWATDRKLQAWADGQAPPGTGGTPAASQSRSHAAPIPGTNPVTGQALPAGATQGGQAMSAPMGSGLVQGATAGSTSASAPPYVPPGTTVPPPGKWSPTQAAAIRDSPQLALQQFLSSVGLDQGQTSRSMFGKFMMNNFKNLWDAYINAQGMNQDGTSNVVGNVQNLLGQFGNAFQGGAGDFTGMMNNTIGGALKGANINMMDENSAKQWLAKLMAGQQFSMNPMLAEIQKNQWEDLLNQRSLTEFQAPNGMMNTGSPFGTFLANQPYWQSVLGR